MLSSFSLVQANALKDAIIQVVKFLDDTPEVDWYRVDRESLIIGWRGIPRLFNQTNRKAARRAAISSGREVHVWAVRHNQKEWKVGIGTSHICSVIAKNNGRIKTDTCPY
ncbi:MAG: hypothetical protein HOM97_06755 [Nitrospina sp.]|nr:hypothetical protein [Nitrospina sp.]